MNKIIRMVLKEKLEYYESKNKNQKKGLDDFLRKVQQYKIEIENDEKTIKIFKKALGVKE